MDLRKLVIVGLQSDMLDDAHLRRLEARAGTIITLPRGDDRLASELADADGLIVGFAVPVPAALIDAAPRLRYLGVASTAYDVVDVQHARAQGTTVTTLPGYTTEPVAQFVLAVMLEQASGLAEGRHQRREGNFNPLAFPARQFAGSEVGVVGLGTIGRRVAQMAEGLGAHVSYWSRTRREDAPLYAYKDLRSLLATSDFVSINLALTEQTRGVIDAELIRAVKPGAVVVSAAPVELVDLDALHERLAKGDLRVVFNHALPPEIERFRDTPNFIEPPLVYLTPEARSRMQDLLLDSLERA